MHTYIHTPSGLIPVGRINTQVQYIYTPTPTPTSTWPACLRARHCPVPVRPGRAVENALCIYIVYLKRELELSK